MESEEQRAALEATRRMRVPVNYHFSAEQISLVGGHSSCTGHSTDEALKKLLFKTGVGVAPVQVRMQ